MQPYVNPNYFAQYQNPYQQRMDFLQNYQQSLQPELRVPVQGNQLNVIGKIVDSVDVVKAMDIPADGKMYYFPKADGTEIFGKQWIVNEGRTHILSFKPILDSNPNNSIPNDIKLNLGLSEDVTEVVLKKLDSLDNSINELLLQTVTKTTKQKSKKESAENE